MTLGISSFIYGWSLAGSSSATSEGLEFALVDKATSLGLRCLQLADNVPLHTRSSDALLQLRNACHEQQIRLEVGARELTPANLERYITISEMLDARLLRFVIDGTGDSHPYEPSMKEVISIIRDFLPLLTKANLYLGLENHDRFKAKDFARIIEQVGNEHVGICLDTANSWGAGEDLNSVAEILAPYTINLHLKDFKIERLSHKMGFTITGAPMGKGMLEITGLLETISKYSNCKSAVLEQWVPPQATLQATRLLEDQWAQEGIHYLKSFHLFNNI